MEATARAGFPPSKAAAGMPKEDITDRWVRVMLRRGVRPTAPAAAAVPNRDDMDDQIVLARSGLCFCFCFPVNELRIAAMVAGDVSKRDENRRGQVRFRSQAAPFVWTQRCCEREEDRD